jgi:hypothetical protein
MEEDPGNNTEETAEDRGVTRYLDVLEKSLPERAKAAIIKEKLVPWIQTKGMDPTLSPHPSRQLELASNGHFMCFRMLIDVL